MTEIRNNNSPTSKHSNIREDFERFRSPRPCSPSVQLLLQQRREKQRQLQLLQDKQQQQHDDDALIKHRFQSLLDEEDEEFMMNIVYGSCQRCFDPNDYVDNNSVISKNRITSEPKNFIVNNVCHEELLPGCQITFEDHLDLFTVSEQIILPW
jgi:hypothetical protein